MERQQLKIDGDVKKQTLIELIEAAAGATEEQKQGLEVATYMLNLDGAFPTFGDDAIEESSGVLSLETQLLGKEVTYQTHTVNGGAPWLGSIHFLERCNATINFKTGLAYFPELNAEQLVYLKKMSSFAKKWRILGPK